MYKVMLCDDEGIVIESLTFMIQKHFGEECQLVSAKTGRKAIELAEDFRPDIAIMDIQMPGINGIEAIKEMKSRNKNMVFIILSAYDQFNYAKQAIDLGVLEYLTKPVNSSRIVEVLQKAMHVIREQRQKISRDLEIKEKLETVIPVIENGFIYDILFQEGSAYDTNNYRSLLEINQSSGYVVVFEYGDKFGRQGYPDNPVGASVKLQKRFTEVKGIVKEYFNCIIGNAMANKIVVLVLYDKGTMEYDERIQIIERGRALLRKLNQKIELQFKMGIGALKEIDQLNLSYKEALYALRNERGNVTHIEDLPAGCEYEAGYPVQTEEKLFQAVKQGRHSDVVQYGTDFFQWMISNYAHNEMEIKLKCIEFILRAEQEAYLNGGMIYSLDNRKGYLETLIAFKDYDELEHWYIEKLSEACNNIEVKQQERSSSLVQTAKAYIKENYSHELSLDEISRQVNISPYYFSKLFKDETGENFIEYVTKIRIEKAKKMLGEGKHSIKEICIEAGYSDPNYFSRIFKKSVGMTPSEFRERGV